MEGAANYRMSYVEPASELIQEEDRDTLVLNLPGFKKDLLKAQLTSESRIMKISGARQLEDNSLAGKKNSKLQPLETRKPQKPTEEPFDAPEKNGERASHKNVPSDGQNKQNGTKNVPEKSHVKEETKKPRTSRRKDLGKFPSIILLGFFRESSSRVKTSTINSVNICESSCSEQNKWISVIDSYWNLFYIWKDS
ncbi:unnamed protein product [Fraxinus pennsylvanica]|uniref:SHSP domain-containing protein n=1 Tax=Fraxinus pennsylvanica TaxID=56036 RepID=A0AAD2A1S5_9LAMI|nr:unnamed protein product [Fraxinus pennsylvanica]